MSGPGVDLGEIGAVVGGIAAGFVGWLTSRSGRKKASEVEESIEEIREDMEWDRQRLDTAMGHIYTVNGVLREAGLPVPELPQTLRARPRPRGGRERHRDHSDSGEGGETH